MSRVASALSWSTTMISSGTGEAARLARDLPRWVSESLVGMITDTSGASMWE
jgi:hypothetical protein